MQSTRLSDLLPSAGRQEIRLCAEPADPNRTPACRHAVRLMRTHSPGFGMIEAILFFSLFVLLVGLLSPMVLQQMVNARVDNTREEMQQIQAAILGEIKTGTFGFVGDVGRLPVNLQELRMPSQGTALYSVDHAHGVGMGWNGPYINWGNSADDYLTDAFGMPYDYLQTGQIRSAGPDQRMSSPDDILVPPQPVNVLGRMAVTVRAFNGQAYLADPPNCSVSLYYAENGAERMVSDAAPPYLFENLPRGLHAVSAACGDQDPAGQPGSTATGALQGYGQTNMIELTVSTIQGAAGAGAAGETAGGDPLAEAKEMLGKQQGLILQRQDLSPMLKAQYEAARNRVVSSIDLAAKQRANQDLAASQRNVQRAMTELDVLYGFVRKSPIGNPQVKESQAVMEMESEIRDRLSKSKSGPPSTNPQK